MSFWTYKLSPPPCESTAPPLPSSPMTFKPWTFLAVALAGWMNRQQQDV